MKRPIKNGDFMSELIQIQSKDKQVKPDPQTLPAGLEKVLRRQKYARIGALGAVKTCHYTKSSISNGPMCYKHKFYGINSHQCIQMTPITAVCNYGCDYCWRSVIPNQEIEYEDNTDDLVEESIIRQNQQLSGLGGSHKVNKQRWLESKTPKHVAISLSGEPTLYKQLPQLIESYHKRGISTFLVTNGSRPEVLKKIPAPTQLYMSFDSPTKELHIKLNKPQETDSWEKMMQSLDILSKMKSRTTIRITALKGKNMDNEKEWAKLIKRGNPMFLEIKGYSWVGISRVKMKEEMMPSMEEVKEFSEKIAKETGYVYKDDFALARVCLLTRPDIKETKIDFSEYEKKAKEFAEKQKALKKTKN